ncbi:hypothetical protein [Haloarchaeobius litoreus]|uniref:DUF8147 domain-containing protein n=1 Tax=Haloarchaeobius litoreus TaxID=755306 RepID=A0ABD6DMD5_9EURY|nr:hypothetical protein [Haloarchaeobius litoreus]
MNWRRLLIALGSGATTFLLVGAAILSVIPDIPGGIIGVFGGLFAGLAAAVGVWVGLGRASAAVERIALGYAAFAYAFLGIWFMRYAHVIDGVGFQGQFLGGIVLAVAVVVVDYLRPPSRAVAE